MKSPDADGTIINVVALYVVTLLDASMLVNVIATISSVTTECDIGK